MPLISVMLIAMVTAAGPAEAQYDAALHDFNRGDFSAAGTVSSAVSDRPATAAATGWSESKVKIKAFRARRRMREAVEKLLQAKDGKLLKTDKAVK